MDSVTIGKRQAKALSFVIPDVSYVRLRPRGWTEEGISVVLQKLVVLRAQSIAKRCSDVVDPLEIRQWTRSVYS